MKWYILKSHDSQQGTLVYHFATKKEARIKYWELVRASDDFNYIYGNNFEDALDVAEVKNKRELVDWLNANYAFDND